MRYNERNYCIVPLKVFFRSGKVVESRKFPAVGPAPSRDQRALSALLDNTTILQRLNKLAVRVASSLTHSGAYRMSSNMIDGASSSSSSYALSLASLSDQAGLLSLPVLAHLRHIHFRLILQ